MMGVLVGATAGLLLPRLGIACGGHVGKVEEEFLDLVGKDGTRKLLATHAVDAEFAVTSAQRFAVSADGKHLVYAHLADNSFKLLRSNGKSASFSAPEGGAPMFNPTNGRSLVLNLRQVGRRRLLVVDTATFESQPWNEFVDVRSVTFTPLGLVVAHDRPNHGGGAITLLEAPHSTKELRRLNFVHTLTQSRGAQLGYFAAAEAFSMDLDSGASVSFGTVPYELSNAAWLGDGLLGITKEGAYWMREKHPYRRRLTDRKLFTVFNHGKHTIAASPDALYVLPQSGGTWWVHRTAGALHDVRPVPGGNELILAQGSDVYQANIGKRTTTLLGSGREGMKLRGAALFDDKLVTWCSKGWEKTTEGHCVPLPNPPGY